MNYNYRYFKNHCFYIKCNHLYGKKTSRAEKSKMSKFPHEK